jgi:hypothetical protein
VTEPTEQDLRKMTSDRIRQLAWWGQLMCVVGMVVLPGILLAALLHSGVRDSLLSGGISVDGVSPLPLNEKARKTIALLMIMPISINAFALWTGFQMFSSYRSGEIFTQRAAKLLGRIGWAILATAPMGLILRAAMTALMMDQSRNPNSAISLSPSLADLDTTAIAFGLLAILVGRVLAEAAKLAEENQSFV